MRRSIPLFGVLLILACISARDDDDDKDKRDADKPAAPAAVEDGISVYFSPDGGALRAIVAQINGAKKTLDVQAYVLTTTKLAKPIQDAHRRGVKVRVLIDKNNVEGNFSVAPALVEHGVKVRVDGKHKEAHNKVMLIDGATVITGSMNFTLAADEENAENVLILTGKPKIAAAYADNFEKHWKHAEKFGE